MKKLEDKINMELYRAGDNENMIPVILEKYESELQNYDVEVNEIICRITLHEKGKLATIKKARKNLGKKQKKQENFIKRVKSGAVEESIRKHINKNYSDKFYVEHSRSVVRSESFYIVDKETGEKVLKLSLHNTPFQEWQYGTEYIDLSNFTSTIDLKKAIDEKIRAI